MFEFVMILAAIAAPLSIWVLRLHRERDFKEQWALMGQRYDLKFRPRRPLRPNMVLYGVFRGHHVRVERLVEGAGRSKREFSDYYVPVSGPWKQITELRNREFSDKVAAKFRGSKGYHVGDEKFDKAFLIQAPVPEEVAHALACEQVQRALLRLKDLAFRMRLEQKRLYLRFQGTTKQAIEIKMILDRMCDAVDAMNDATVEPGRLRNEGSTPLFEEIDSPSSQAAW